MKKIFHLSLLTIFVFTACKKVENKIYFEGGTPPTVTASTNAVRLEAGEEANVAIRFSWTNPDYKFTTGLSSQDVNYALEIDTLGTNFTSKNKYATVIAKDLSKSFTVADLNGIFGNTMLLPLGINIPRRTYTFQARITASISGSVKLASNVITFTAKPFAPPPKVAPPAAGDLWMTGDAAPSSWTLSPPPAQKFTSLSPTTYQLTIALAGGGNYKLLQEGAWGSQYRMVAGTWQSGEFDQKDADPAFPGPPTPGTYKITVDFQLGVFNVVKQ